MDVEKIKILVVDDDPGDIRLVKLALSNPPQNVSFTIETTESLSDTLKALAENKFDTVLLDLGLPDSTGLSAVEKIQHAYPDISIVVLTGLADENVAVNAIKAGANDYIVKGSDFFKDILSRTIRYSLERKKMANKL